MIPTAALMGRATEELAARSGPGIGGLLNVTFGNAPELIIALFALHQGLQEVVKASIVGSIIGNILLVMGASMLVGGLGRERQRFNATAAQRAGARCCCSPSSRSSCRRSSSSSTGSGLPKPAAEVVNYGSTVEHLSVAAHRAHAAYVGGLIFSLGPTATSSIRSPRSSTRRQPWPVRRSVRMLAIAGVAVGVMSEILVGSITEAAREGRA